MNTVVPSATTTTR